MLTIKTNGEKQNVREKQEILEKQNMPRVPRNRRKGHFPGRDPGRKLCNYLLQLQNRAKKSSRPGEHTDWFWGIKGALHERIKGK
jgi:hypothetical protein